MTSSLQNDRNIMTYVQHKCCTISFHILCTRPLQLIGSDEIHQLQVSLTSVWMFWTTVGVWFFRGTVGLKYVLHGADVAVVPRWHDPSSAHGQNFSGVVVGSSNKRFYIWANFMCTIPKIPSTYIWGNLYDLAWEISDFLLSKTIFGLFLTSLLWNLSL